MCDELYEKCCCRFSPYWLEAIGGNNHLSTVAVSSEHLMSGSSPVSKGQKSEGSSLTDTEPHADKKLT